MPLEYCPEPRTPTQYKDIKHNETLSKWVDSTLTYTKAKSISIK